jgi:hypothetical protein
MDIADSSIFENTVLLTILANSIVLAMEDPLEPEDEKSPVWATLEYVFLTIYTIEMITKIIAMGFVLAP